MVIYCLNINWNIDPEIFRIGGFGLRYYSLFFAIAFLTGYMLMKRIYRKEGLSDELLGSLFIYILLGTVIGARLGQTLFYEFDYFKNHPMEIILPFKIGDKGFEWTGYQGLASHGGAIGILAAIALYARKYKLPFLMVADLLVVIMPLAGFFIRVGNLFNSEIVGVSTSVPWAFVFERVDKVPRHPAQLYEALSYLIIFFFLWVFYKKNRGRFSNGLLLGFFLSLVFTARFAIEFIKEDQEAFEKGWLINMGQVLSIPFILAGLYLIWSKSGTNRKATNNVLSEEYSNEKSAG